MARPRVSKRSAPLALARKFAGRRAESASGEFAVSSTMLGDTARGPYVGASNRPSLSSWVTSSGDADSDLLNNLAKLRDRSEDEYRNMPAARGAIKRLVTGAVGPGLAIRSTPDWKFLGMGMKEARAWADKAEREFRFWAGSRECDFCRRMTFGEMQILAFSSQKKRGDCFALLPWKRRAGVVYDLRVQLIEADRVSNPNHQADTDRIRGGIERDADGVPIAIHVASIHPGNDINRGWPKWEKIPIFGTRTGRRNVLHLMEHERIDQSRGEPGLAPVIETLKQLSKFSEAELSSAVINAILSVFVKRAPEAEGFEGKGAAYSEDQRERWESTPMDLGTGTWIEGAPGEELQIVSANRPNSQYDAFYSSCLKQIGMAIGVPFEVLLQHFQSSYSASRAALLEYSKGMKVSTDWLKSNFCQPVYEEFLTEAVIKGRIHAPGFLNDPVVRAAYCQTDWIGPTTGQIDPVKEVEAANLRVKYKFSTRGREAAELTGMDWEHIINTQSEELDLLREMGMHELTGDVKPVQAEVVDDPDKRDKDET